MRTRNMAKTKGSKASALPTRVLDEPLLAWKVLDYYSKGMFDRQEHAALEAEPGKVAPRQLVDVGAVVSRINAEGGGCYTIAAMKRSLAVRGLHVSVRGRVDVREIEDLYRRYCKAAGLTGDDGLDG